MKQNNKLTFSQLKRMLRESFDDEDLEFDSYKDEYFSIWKPVIEKFEKAFNDSEYLQGNIWMTDCDDDVEKFPEFFYTNGFKNQPIEDLFLLCDVRLSENAPSSAQDIVSDILGPEEDIDLTDSAYWRFEIKLNNVNALIAKLNQINKLITDNSRGNIDEVMFENKHISLHKLKRLLKK